MIEADHIRKEIAGFLDTGLSTVSKIERLEDLIPDSYLLVELFLHLQQHFDVVIDEERFQAITTVSELVALVQSGDAGGSPVV